MFIVPILIQLMYVNKRDQPPGATPLIGGDVTLFVWQSDHEHLVAQFKREGWQDNGPVATGTANRPQRTKQTGTSVSSQQSQSLLCGGVR